MAAIAGIGWRVYAQTLPGPDLLVLLSPIRLDGEDLTAELYRLLDGRDLGGEHVLSVRRTRKTYSSPQQARDDAQKRGASLAIWSRESDGAALLSAEFLAIPPLPRFAEATLALPERLRWRIDRRGQMDSPAQALSGWASQALGQHQEAVEAWRTALSSAPPEAEAAIRVHLAAISVSREHDIPRALEQLNLATQADARTFPGHLALAAIYGVWCGAGDARDRALEHALTAAELDPSNPVAHEVLGDVQARLGLWPEASASYAQGLAYGEDSLSLWNKLGKADYALERDEEAESAFAQVLTRAQARLRAQGALTADAWSELGLAYGYLSLTDPAIEAFRAAQSLDPEGAIHYQRLAEMHGRRGEWTQAHEAYLQAVERAPWEPASRKGLADTLRAMDAYEEAEDAYLAAIQLASCDAESYLSLAQIYFDRAELDLAVAYFEQGLALEPTNAEAQYALGVSCYLGQEWDKAIAAFDASVAIAPENAQACLGLARAHLQLQEYAAARDAYERAVILLPDSVSAWAELGDAQRGMRDYDAAERSYQKALQLAPGDANLWLSLALLYEGKGDLDPAVAAYKAALEIKDSPVGRAALASAYQRKGSLALAAQEFEIALAGEPSNPEYQVSLALVYIAQDRLARALDLIDLALEAQPDYALAHFLQGLVMEKQGRSEEAIAAYRLAVRYGGQDPALVNNARAQLERLGQTP